MHKKLLMKLLVTFHVLQRSGIVKYLYGKVQERKHIFMLANG